MTDEFDLVVIGCGPAGEKGANQVAHFGHRVAVVERRPRAGGAATWMRRETYGVGISLAPDVVMDRLRARVSYVVDTMSGAVEGNLRRHGIEFVRGDATLGPGRTVVVRDLDGGERTLRARVILLAAGSLPGVGSQAARRAHPGRGGDRADPHRVRS